MSHATDAVDSCPTPWFIIWTRARAEKKVETRIKALGLSPWLPTVTERHRWSDRWKEVVSPLFPGYLFARSTALEWNRVLRIPGVLTVVKERGVPVLLRDDFVARLREAVAVNSSAVERVFLHDFSPGDEVIVQEGAFKGMRGVVRERRNRRQIVIWIGQIGHGVALTIGHALVNGVSDSTRGITAVKV